MANDKKSTGSRVRGGLISALRGIGLRWPPANTTKDKLRLGDKEQDPDLEKLDVDAEHVDDDDYDTESPSSPRTRRKSLSRERPTYQFLTGDASFYNNDNRMQTMQEVLSRQQSVPTITKSILEDVEAVDQSGAPQEVAERIAQACRDYGIAISIRSSYIGSDTPQRYYEGLFTAKNTNIHTKSTKIYCPARGHIAKNPENFESEKAKDLYDHQDANFPEEATELSVAYMSSFLGRLIMKKLVPDDIEELKEMFIASYSAHHRTVLLDNTHDEKITAIKDFNGRLCFAIERDSYHFAELDKRDKNGKLISKGEIPDALMETFVKSGEKSITFDNKIFVKSGAKIYVKTGERQTDHYMQEVESLGSVLIGLSKGAYKNLSFDPKTKKLTYYTADPTKAYCINLNDLPHGHSQEEMTQLTETIWTRAGSGKQQQSISAVWNNLKLPDDIRANLFPYVDQIMVGEDIPLPVYERKGSIDSPVLIVADPYPITNDLDLANVAVPKPPALPDAAYQIYDLFSTTGRKNLKKAAKALLKELAKNPDNKYSAKVMKLLELDKIDPKTGKSYLDLCFEERILGRMGGMSLAEFLYGCAINKAVDPTGKIQIIRHGPESKNPLIGQEKPEPFGAMIHIYEDKKVHTNDEQSCLNFYLFHEDYMRDKYIEVHPYWLRERDLDEPALNTVWMDIIKYQASNGWSEIIKRSYDDMKDKYPDAYKKVMALLKEVKKLNPNLRQAQAANIAYKYKTGFTGSSFRDFNEYSILSRHETESPTHRSEL